MKEGTISCAAVDSARSFLGCGCAEGGTAPNLLLEHEPQAEGHEERREDPHQDEDREQGLVDEPELEAEGGDHELHRPAPVHRDAGGDAVPSGELRPTRAEISPDELAP